VGNYRKKLAEKIMMFELWVFIFLFTAYLFNFLGYERKRFF
jgi:hypothetical protein